MTGPTKFVRRFILVVMFGPNFIIGQSIRDTFVLDKSKPFAYLSFDHIGKGKPYYEGDVQQRLYLRVVNNSSIPILFRSNSAPDGELGSIIDDEIVPEDQILQVVSTQEQMNRIKDEERDREAALKSKPAGYTSEVSGILRVPSGKDALFSIPLNHITRFWFMRIKFALDLDRSSLSIGPFTYLDFHAYDIPKK